MNYNQVANLTQREMTLTLLYRIAELGHDDVDGSAAIMQWYLFFRLDSTDCQQGPN